MEKAKKNFRGLSIFYKLLLCFAGISIVAVLVSGFMHYVRTTKVIRASIEKQLESNLKAAISHFDKTYASYIKRDLMTLESSPSIDNLLTVQEDQVYFHKPEVERKLLNLSRDNSKYLSISFFNASGSELVNIRGAKRIKNYRSINQLTRDDVFSDKTAALFRRLKSAPSRSILFEGPFRHTNDRHTFLIGISKMEPDIGGFGGAIILHIDLLSYIEYLSDLKIFGRSIIWMVDNDNNVILSPPENEMPLDPRTYLDNQNSSDDASHIISENAILGSNDRRLLRVILSVPPDMISSEMKETLFMTLMVGLGVLIISMTAAFFLSKQFSKPISHLVKKSLSISSGDFNVKASREIGGELGLLAQTMNEMTDNLQITTVTKDYVDNILCSMNDSLIVTNPDGVIKTVNNATLDLLGYKAEELLGEPIEKVFPESSSFRELREDILAAEKVIINFETEYIAKDSNIIPVSFSSSVMHDKNSGIQGIVCMAQDNTERKMAERALQKAKQEAETANFSKSQFLANMSHELRTPMNAVLGFSDLLKYTELDEEQKDYIETITASGHVLLSLINDVLDLSKIESGKLKLESIDFDVRQVAESLLKIVRTKVRKRHVKLVCDISENIPRLLIGDPTRIRQVIMNLLSNAAKFTHEGEIILSLSRSVASDASKEDNVQNIRISVKDTGVGIPGDKQKAVFDAFVQEDSSTTREYGGTGLGLAIVSRFVEAMDGDIELVSERGKGSEFIVTLPLKTWASVKNDDMSVKGSGESDAGQSIDDKFFLKGLKVLLVEDNAANRKLVKTFLEKLDCEIHVACDGQEAIEKVRKNKYDIVFMDIQMPGMNGIEATETIRKTVNRDIPIVALTAAVMEEDRRKSMASGMNDYLTKPVKLDNLKEMLFKWTRGEHKTLENANIVSGHNS